MIYTEAQIIRKGYQFERCPNYNATAATIRRWLAAAINRYPDQEAEILRLWDQCRAEARLR
jgi:hypothetical protein